MFIFCSLIVCEHFTFYLMIEISKVLFFDGDCNFCNRSVQFFYSKNKNKSLFYSSLQSDFAKSVLPSKFLEKTPLDTMYFYSNGVYYSKSTAVLKALKHVSSPFKYFSFFIVVPLFIRNFIYDVISKRRHNIIRESNSCSILSADDKFYFLEDKLDSSRFILI